MPAYFINYSYNFILRSMSGKEKSKKAHVRCMQDNT